MTLEQLVEAYGLEWETFADELEEMDHEAYTGLWNHAKRNAHAVTKIQQPNLFESVVMAIPVEHQKELSQMQQQLLPDESKTCPRCNQSGALDTFFKRDTTQVGILCNRCQEALFFQ